MVRHRAGPEAAWFGTTGLGLNQAGKGTRILARRWTNASFFGCVYEYKTRAGRPIYVGDTDASPEHKFLSDLRGTEPEVRTLAMHQGVTLEVVWAGAGQGPVGPEEMRVIR